MQQRGDGPRLRHIVREAGDLFCVVQACRHREPIDLIEVTTEAAYPDARLPDEVRRARQPGTGRRPRPLVERQEHRVRAVRDIRDAVAEVG